MILWGKSYTERYKNWDKEGKVTRPSFGEIEIFKKFIGPLSKDKKILILGPTPELRDLVAGYPAVVADLSYDSLVLASKYVKRARKKDETLIEANWLELPFPKEYFDIILGDLVLNQFSPGEDEKRFLQTIHLLCKKNGRFISRFMFTSKYSKPELLGTNIAFVCSVNSLSRNEKIFVVANVAISCTSDHIKRIANLYMAYSLLNKLSRSSKLNFNARLICKEAEKYLKKNGLVGGRWWTSPQEEDLINMLTNYFVITDRESTNDYPAGRLPILNCIPKIV